MQADGGEHSVAAWRKEFGLPPSEASYEMHVPCNLWWEVVYRPGWLYIFEHHVCFLAAMGSLRVVISYTEVVSLQRAASMMNMVSSAIQISTVARTVRVSLRAPLRALSGDEYSAPHVFISDRPLLRHGIRFATLSVYLSISMWQLPVR